MVAHGTDGPFGFIYLQCCQHRFPLKIVHGSFFSSAGCVYILVV